MIDLTRLEAISEPVSPHISIDPIFTPKCLKTALERPEKEPEQVIHGMLHRSCKMILCSTSKAGKSWALMQLAFAVAHGEKWITFGCTKGRVLYVDFEIKEAILQKRFQAMADQVGLSVEEERIHYLSLRGKQTELSSMVEHLINASAKYDYSLIVIDPIYKIQLGDENSARDINRLCTMLDTLAEESNAAVAYSHHFSKGNFSEKSSIDRASGSGVFARDSDAILVLTPLQKEHTYVLESTLRNFAPVKSVGVKKEGLVLLSDDSLDITKLKGSKSGKPMPTDEEILNILPELESEESVNHSDLKELITKYEFPRDKTLKRVNSLADAGYILKVKAGKSTNYYRSGKK